MPKPRAAPPAGAIDFDVIVIGAGPAGMSAALVLARCRHSVLVVDSGKPRNAAARGVHAYLTRDGISPLELRALGRQELRRYRVTVRAGEAVSAKGARGGFRVLLASGEALRSRGLVIATGVRDRIPDIPGLAPLYGKSVHHCPFCEGWEERDRPLAVYGKGKAGHGLALKLKAWSADVVLVSDGPSGLRSRPRRELEAEGIALLEERIAAVEGIRGRLRRIRFADGSTLERAAMFFATGHEQSCDLALQLGCSFTRSGAVRTGRGEKTCVPRLYVVGDASRDVQLSIFAAAEGVKAAVFLHAELDQMKRTERRRKTSAKGRNQA